MSERLEDLAVSFARDLRAENRSPRTVRVYCQGVTYFRSWLAARDRPPTLEEMTRAAIRAWLAELSETKAPGTVRTYYRAMHRFCQWLAAERILGESPMDNMPLPAVPEHPVPIVSDEDLAKLLKACSGTRFYDRRDEAVIRVLIDCGVRVSELCGLSTQDVDLDHQMAIVLGKGRKRRPIYFSAKTVRALDRYERDRRKHKQAAFTDAWFLGERGPMTPDGVRELLRVRAEAAGIEHVHPHRLRHSWAHDFLMAGGQQQDLKRLAGWTSDAMLARYGASMADVRAQEAARRLRRGDRL